MKAFLKTIVYMSIFSIFLVVSFSLLENWQGFQYPVFQKSKIFLENAEITSKKIWQASKKLANKVQNKIESFKESKSKNKHPFKDNSLIEPKNLANKSSSILENHSTHNHSSKYICPMHPQIVMDQEDICPICGMDLVSSKGSGENSTNSKSLELSSFDRRIAGIKSILVEPEVIYKEVDATGVININEKSIKTISSYVSGRIDTLYANYIGKKIYKGEKIAEIYSPELYTAQMEFLKFLESYKIYRTTSQKDFVSSSFGRLIDLGMTKKQIGELKKNNKPNERFILNSQLSGTLIKKNSLEGNYIKKGQSLISIADLSTVWLEFEVFSEDSGYIKYAQKAMITIQADSSKILSGRVAFIDPMINKNTRTLRIIVELKNDGSLKPGDLAFATLKYPVGSNSGKLKIYDPELAGKWISPTSPHLIFDSKDSCSKCLQPLIPTKNFGYVNSKNEMESVMVVPRDAVLKIGRESIVFVEDAKDTFSIRKVKTGPTIKDKIVILDGLEEYESVAFEGVFLLDSQMQLSGKTSLKDIQ